jgi:hypothetical protein
MIDPLDVNELGKQACILGILRLYLWFKIKSGIVKL